MDEGGRGWLELGKKDGAKGTLSGPREDGFGSSALRPEKMGRLRRWSEGEEMYTGSGPPHCQEGKEGTKPKGTAVVNIIWDLVVPSRVGENQLAIAPEEGKERQQRKKGTEGGDHTYAAGVVDLRGRRRRSARRRFPLLNPLSRGRGGKN